ncbi:tripartite motif-containing protein 2-like [Saccostrea cucullata]|uniref:tripartite motif-containing protein 2-like n=1 Tax=Saccostrea cuccullata TaxID=36930 RepID=UPI002ED5ABEE
MDPRTSALDLIRCDLCGTAVCLASDQHLGHSNKLSEILKIVDDKKSKIIKDQIELKEKIYPTYQDIASDVQKRMNEVDEMKNTQLQTLQKHLVEINDSLSEIKDVINSVEMALDTNDTSKLFAVKLNLDRYRKLPQKVLPSNLKFLLEKIQRKELSNLFGTLLSSSLTSDEHGYSMKTTQKSPETGSSPPVKQLLDELETVITIETGYGSLDNVACLSDEEILMSGNDETMKIYNINQGSLLKSITTKSGYKPSDIAVTKSGDLVYTDDSDRTVNIIKNEKIEKVIRLQNWRPDGVCCTSSDDLLVIMESDDKQTKNRPFNPLGITTDSQSHILTADPKNDCVHIIDQDGQFLRYIDCGLSYPWGLCIDTNDSLFVAQMENRQLKKIKYLK